MLLRHFELGLSKATLSHHFKRAARSGVVRTRPDGRKRLLSLRADDLGRALPRPARRRCSAAKRRHVPRWLISRHRARPPRAAAAHACRSPLRRPTACAPLPRARGTPPDPGTRDGDRRVHVRGGGRTGPAGVDPGGGCATSWRRWSSPTRWAWTCWGWAGITSPDFAVSAPRPSRWPRARPARRTSASRAPYSVLSCGRPRVQVFPTSSRRSTWCREAAPRMISRPRLPLVESYPLFGYDLDDYSGLLDREARASPRPYGSRGARPRGTVGRHRAPLEDIRVGLPAAGSGLRCRLGGRRRRRLAG